ncbi:hypothetical protein NPIL_203591 [Nephila pilipes]|uniref:Uncharacterized protein n=1 Tax=Nephila pilipes TaxID=299642 RepID=A0A8X6Q8F2_NEPPI|nr:hypothetical protein NPIL_203591 [Nephila pilipes]
MLSPNVGTSQSHKIGKEHVGFKIRTFLSIFLETHAHSLFSWGDVLRAHKWDTSWTLQTRRLSRERCTNSPTPFVPASVIESDPAVHTDSMPRRPFYTSRD